MTTHFKESRWRMMLPWCILVLIAIIAEFIPAIAKSQVVSSAVRLCACIAAILALQKLIFPRTVLAIDGNKIMITGVVPGWWKLFQRWRMVIIPLQDVIDVRIGKIREKGPFGFPVLPIGEPSKGSVLRNFLWIRYRNGEDQREIYYPHFNNIHDWPQALERLRHALDSKILEWN